MTLRVLHLVGSAVSDFHAELSRLYAADCLASTADPARYEFHIAYVSPDGRWRFPTGLDERSIAAAPALPVAEAIGHLLALRVDVMVPQMFCLPGLTHYRALFDLLAIPYVGNSPAVMAMTADKARARALVAAAGVDVPAGEVVRPGDRPTLRAPVVVKPVDADNSLGVTLVREDAGMDDALRTAYEHAGAALVERFVPAGREVRCGIVERDGQLACLPLEEYRLDSATPIRMTGDKLVRSPDGRLGFAGKNDSERAWIVDVGDPITAPVWDLARRCHVALGCRHYSLVDVRIDPDGRPWFLEAGLYCSFARTSVVAIMAAAAGMGLNDLFATAVREALASAAVTSR